MTTTEHLDLAGLSAEDRALIGEHLGPIGGYAFLPDGTKTWTFIEAELASIIAAVRLAAVEERDAYKASFERLLAEKERAWDADTNHAIEQQLRSELLARAETAEAQLAQQARIIEKMTEADQRLQAKAEEWRQAQITTSLELATCRDQLAQAQQREVWRPDPKDIAQLVANYIHAAEFTWQPEINDGVRRLAGQILALAPQSGWKTMDSAPRDGTPIITLSVHGVHKACWTDVDGGGHPENGPLIYWWSSPTTEFIDGPGDEPTHWQPLPAPHLLGEK